MSLLETHTRYYMTRPQYDAVDLEDREAHLGSRSDILSKSFVTDLWMKVIARAIDDIVTISLIKQQNITLKEEDLEIEETALGFLFDDDYRISLDDYIVSIICPMCENIFNVNMSIFSCDEAICTKCNKQIDPNISDYRIFEHQSFKDISLKELLATWNIENIDEFREGVRERIRTLVEKKSEASENRAKLKNERKNSMANRVVEKVTPKIKEDNFEVVTDQQLTEFDKGIMKVLDGVKEMLMAKNRKYGNSATNPVRAFSKADPREQIKVRIDDKISRLVRSTSQEEDEDVCDDLIGYLVILTALNKGYIKY